MMKSLLSLLFLASTFQVLAQAQGPESWQLVNGQTITAAVDHTKPLTY